MPATSCAHHQMRITRVVRGRKQLSSFCGSIPADLLIPHDSSKTIAYFPTLEKESQQPRGVVTLPVRTHGGLAGRQPHKEQNMAATKTARGRMPQAVAQAAAPTRERRGGGKKKETVLTLITVLGHAKVFGLLLLPLLFFLLFRQIFIPLFVLTSDKPDSESHT